MLIELADELAADLAGDEVEALGNILSARRSGFHLLTARDEVFAKLRENASLADRERGILDKSRGKQYEKAGLLGSVSVRARVTRRTGPLLERNDDGETVVVPLRYFARYGAAGKSVVLGESDRDAELAVRMAEYFAHTRNLEAVPLQPRVAEGGGQRTNRAFRRWREDPRFCLCVVDSDREAPGGCEGKTATAVRGEVDEEKPWAAVEVLACREAENTLPLGLIFDTFGNDGNYREKLERLKQFEDGAPFGAYRDYCDFKNGTTLRWAFRLKEEDSRRFWLGSEATATRAPLVKAECLREEACRRPREGPEKQNCACEIAPGLGGKLLAKCLEVAENTPDRELDCLLCPKTRPYWRAVGRAVFSWACGTGETRV